MTRTSGPVGPGTPDPEGVLPEDADAAAARAAEDDAHAAGLRAVLGSSLVAGPDPDVVEEVLGAPEVTRDETEASTARAEADAEVQRIYAEVLSRAPEHDVQPSLERVEQVLELLGDPHRAYPVIHVAGTNGKTTTTRVVERLLRESGLRTGRFTSPHLTSVRERIALDGEPVDAETFVETWREVEPLVRMVDERSEAAGGPRLSFFEVFTVLALAAFADAAVDVAVVEVGMGGRWDATNVVDAEIAVVTSISRDHERWLGSDLAAIAAEKAGILTPGCTVVSAEQVEEVEPVLRDASHALDARLLRDGADLAVLDRQIAVGGQMLTLSTPAATYADVYLPLHGEHQAHNALLGLVAVETFFGGKPLDAGVVEQAMASADSPGRLEVVRTSPRVIVDAAHNPAGIDALRAALEEAFDLDRLVGVVGVMRDKDAEAILAGLEPLLAEVVITRAGTDRAHEVDDLAEIARDVFDPDRVHVAERLDEALDLAVGLAEAGETGPEPGAVLVTGSVVLVAEARILLGRP